MADITYDLCILTPSDIEMDVVGSSIEGGRSVAGVTQSIDYSGGGFVAVTYGGIFLQTFQQHKEWNRLAAVLNGSVRTVRVPLWADPVAIRDGSGAAAGSSGGPADPTAAADAALAATSLDISLPAGVTVEGGEWFSINHGGTVENHSPPGGGR